MKNAFVFTDKEGETVFSSRAWQRAWPEERSW